MENDLRRLLNEFIEQTVNYRTNIIDAQLTNDMPKKYKEIVREPTLLDLIDWLNGDIDEEEERERVRESRKLNK